MSTSRNTPLQEYTPDVLLFLLGDCILLDSQFCFDITHQVFEKNLKRTLVVLRILQQTWLPSREDLIILLFLERQGKFFESKTGPVLRCFRFITSPVSGRGHRIGAICVCVLSRPNHLTYEQEI